MPDLDREDFRQWLVAKEPDEVVGFSDDRPDCPGDLWLSEVFEIPVATVSVAYTLVRAGSLFHGPLPWLCEFAATLDARFPEADPVTAKQALEVLDSLDVS